MSSSVSGVTMQHGVMSRGADGQYGSLNVRKTRVNSFLPDGSETKLLPRPASSPASCNQQHGGLSSSRRADGTPPGFSPHTRQAAEKMQFRGSQPAPSDTSPLPFRETSFLSTSKRADNLFVASVPSSPVSGRYRSPYDVGFTIRMIEQGEGSGKEKIKPSSAPPARPRSTPQVHQISPVPYRVERGSRCLSGRSPNSPPPARGHLYQEAVPASKKPSKYGATVSPLVVAKVDVGRTSKMRTRAASSPEDSNVSKSREQPFPVHILIPLLGEDAGDVQFARKCMQLQQTTSEDGSTQIGDSYSREMPMPLFIDLCPRPCT